MADPFSIAVGAMAVASACVSLGRQIYQLQKDIGGINNEVSTLLSDVDGLGNLCQTVKAMYETRTVDVMTQSTEQAQLTDDLWAHLGKGLENCLSVVTKLDGIFEKIRGNPEASVSGKIDALKKVLRKRLREKDLQDCRTQMAAYQSALQIVLSAIIRHDIGVSHEHSTRSFEALSQDFENLGENIQSQIRGLQQSIKSEDSSHYHGEALAALRDLKESVNFAAVTIKSTSTNHHFDVPQSVSSIFTGRDNLLDELRGAFFPKQSRGKSQFQRRFVIHGVNGSLYFNKRSCQLEWLVN
jgi:DNA-binding FrmR family transcriptional regulator